MLVDDEVYAQGRNEAIWNGRDDSGRKVAAGVYFYRFEAEGHTDVRRMALVVAYWDGTSAVSFAKRGVGKRAFI